MLPLSHVDWPRILHTRSAAILLGVASTLSVPTLVLIHSDSVFNTLSLPLQTLFSILGASGAFGLVALLVCMGFFWLQCDPSAKQWRAIWFVILLVGFAFGSAVAYYIFVYLPALKNRTLDPLTDDAHLAQVEEKRSLRRIGPFSGAVLFIWLVLLLPLLTALIFPKIMTHALGPIAITAFAFWSFVVVLESAAHGLYSIFRTGMRRPGGF